VVSESYGFSTRFDSCLTVFVGEIFLGKSFGGLDNEQPPDILEDLDHVFPTYWIEWQFPMLFRLLRMVPHKGLHNFITTGHRFYRVKLLTFRYLKASSS
jgi:hypothetical protein